MEVVIEIDGVRHKLIRAKKNVCTRCSMVDNCHLLEFGCLALSLSGRRKSRFEIEK